MTRAIAQLAQAAVYRHFHPAFSPSCGKDIPARGTWEGVRWYGRSGQPKILYAELSLRRERY